MPITPQGKCVEAYKAYMYTRSKIYGKTTLGLLKFGFQVTVVLDSRGIKNVSLYMNT